MSDYSDSNQIENTTQPDTGKPASSRLEASMQGYINDTSPSAANQPVDSNSPAADVKYFGDESEVEQLQNGLSTLESTDQGKSLAASLRENGVGIRFSNEIEMAAFNPNTNEILLSEKLKDAPPNVLAAHLAHEGTHADWFARGIQQDSIDQEYNAFLNEKKVWDQVKGDTVDGQCDWVNQFMSQSEADAKSVLRFYYPELPEYGL